MQRFIVERNIAHFRRLIATERDASKLDVLRRLLAEEEAKLSGLPVKGAMPPTPPDESRGQ